VGWARARREVLSDGSRTIEKSAMTLDAITQDVMTLDAIRLDAILLDVILLDVTTLDAKTLDATTLHAKTKTMPLLNSTRATARTTMTSNRNCATTGHDSDTTVLVVEEADSRDHAGSRGRHIPRTMAEELSLSCANATTVSTSTTAI
jgi:hypothetical protein